jgi:hypothetical protein
MGKIVHGECECGYSNDFTVGGARSQPKGWSRFPVLCRSCGKASDNDLDDAEATCHHCGGIDLLPYSDSSLSSEVGRGSIGPWSSDEKNCKQLRFNEASYYCPRCKKMCMQFLIVCFFD